MEIVTKKRNKPFIVSSVHVLGPRSDGLKFRTKREISIKEPTQWIEQTRSQRCRHFTSMVINGLKTMAIVYTNLLTNRDPRWVHRQFMKIPPISCLNLPKGIGCKIERSYSHKTTPSPPEKRISLSRSGLPSVTRDDRGMKVAKRVRRYIHGISLRPVGKDTRRIEVVLSIWFPKRQ